MDNRILIGAITAVVVVVMLGSVLMPVIDDATTGKSESNPDAGWIRMNYDTAAGSTYTVTITPGDDGITVANGSDTQTGSDDTIFYADSNVAVWMQDGTVNILGQNTDGPQFLQPEEAITITRTAEGVTVASGGDSLSFATPDWAYVPFSSGSYGYFTNGTATNTNGKQIAAVGGGFAGVYAYNDITRYAGLGLQLQTDTEGGKLTGAYWAKPAAADSLSITPFDPGSITIQPLDPGVISLDPEPDASIMSVPQTPYRDGDWGFYLPTWLDGALIGAYYGSSGNIVMPATVSNNGTTYTVVSMGEGSGSTTNIFDGTAITDSTLKLPNTLTTVRDYAMPNCPGFIGELVIPEGVTSIGNNAFYGSGFDTVVIPSSVTTVHMTAVRSMANLTNLIVASDFVPTSYQFYGDPNVSEILDLSDDVDYASNLASYSLPTTATVQDNIGDSAGYMGVAYIEGEAPLGDGATAILMAVPVLVIFSLIVAALVIFLKRSY